MAPKGMPILAWCGVVAPTLRLGFILVLGTLHPGYSQLRDFISELGADQAPFAALMNLAGTGLVGVLLAAFSVPLYNAHKPGRLALGGAGLLALSGLAFIAVGLFPCDPGCSLATPSGTMRLHLFAGMVAMGTQTAAPLAFGMRFLTKTGDRRHAAVSLVLGFVALSALFVLFGLRSVVPFPGLAQKVYQVAADLWVFMSALYVLRRSRPAA